MSTTPDYAAIGAAFVGILASSAALGHVSPAAAADYVDRGSLTTEQALVLDAFTATRLDSPARSAQERVAAWVAAHSEQARVLAEAAGRIG